MFFIKMHSFLNLKNPKTFNEKMQWLKLYDRKNEYSDMVDKYQAKIYVKNQIGDDYIIPTIGIYDNFNDIDFEKLPNEFVMKCTHDSSGIVICEDKKKLNIEIAKKKINDALSHNYYLNGREWPYKNIKSRIIIEKYLKNDSTNDLKDYKFFCFNGIVKYFKIDFDRYTNHRANYYDRNGNLMNFGEKICPPDYNKKISMPLNLNKMIELAETLSKNNYFLRVDFYEVNGKIYFGELTFYPASGFGRFIPNEWDIKLGELISLSNKNMEEIQ